MSGDDPPLNLTILSIKNVDNQYYVKYEVPSFKALDLFRPAGEIVTVTTSESCPEDDVKAIKALCRHRGFIYEEPAHASGASSGSSRERPSSSSGKGKPSTSSGKEKK